MHLLIFLGICYIIYFLEFRLWKRQQEFSDAYNAMRDMAMRRQPQDHRPPHR